MPPFSIPQFLQDANLPSLTEAAEAEALFTVVTSGGFAGRTYKTVLYRNGSVAGYLWNGDRYAAPTDLGKVSPQRLQQFVEQLQRSRFEAFNGLHYPVPAGAADFLTVALRDHRSQSTVQYEDANIERLPESLARIVQVWTALLVQR